MMLKREDFLLKKERIFWVSGYISDKQKRMDIQAEKYKLIEWLINLDDPETLIKLNAFRYKVTSSPFVKLTAEELAERAKRSNEAIQRDDVYDLDVLIRDE